MKSWITEDPTILGGKPCIRGTRISVDLVLGYLAQGFTISDILAFHPGLEREAVVAAIQYAADRMRTPTSEKTPVHA